jgi:inner membrane protein
LDSLSQIVLGGAVGEAVLGKKVGNKAVLWGAIGGTIPDLDTIPGQFLDTVSRLEIHRGFSHSIIFAILIAPLLGYLLHRLYWKKKETDMWGWTWLMFWSIFTHPLLDIFTTWGTQLFWPLDWRIAIQSIFVIDPLYTLPFLLCLTVVLFLKRRSTTRRKLNRLGLALSTGYLLYTLGVKLYVDGIFKESLEENKLVYERFDSRPTPFNSVLWTSNVESKDAFQITYYSLLDKDKTLEYFVFPKNEELLRPYRNAPEVERLIHLTKGFYTLEKSSRGVIMNDLRFGLTEGFDNGKGNFVFRYLIQMKGDKVEISQEQQSFKGVDAVLKKLWQRILGNKL